MLRRVISGGQTGVDRAALDAALVAGLELGGSCPAGRRSEAGPIPARYPLKELPTTDYLSRTHQNVDDGDATLVLTFGIAQGGTEATIQYACSVNKPHHLVDMNVHPSAETVVRWIRSSGIRVLNVAGPRGSKEPRVYPESLAFLRTVFHLISR